MARRLPLLALLVAVAAAIWWGRSAFDSRPQLETPVGSRPEAPLPWPNDKDGGDGSVPPAGASPTEVARVPAPRADAAAATDAKDASAPRELRGTIVGVDEHGVEQRELDGKFLLRQFVHGKVEAYDVEVHRGSWEIGLEPPSEIAIDEIALGERIGRTPTDTFVVPADGVVALRVELVAPSSLRVIDAATRAPLAGIDVHVDAEELKGSRLYRGPKVVGLPPLVPQLVPQLVKSASSPVKLPPIGGQPVLWVHVPGYAWSRIQIQFLKGGEREVALERGATLEVVLAPHKPAADVELTLKRDDATWKAAWSELSESELATLVDFPPGALDVEVGAGETALAAARAELRAGETTRVVLLLADVALPDRTKRVPFRGTLAGPAESVALARHALLLLEPLKEIAVADARFDFGQVVPGRCVVTIEPIQVHRAFDVGGEGLVDAVIELPALADVEVEVTDARSGEALAQGGVSWRTVDHPLPERNFVMRVDADPAAKVSRFRAPPGRIVLQVWPDGYDLAEHELEVRPGPNRATIAVRLQQFVRVLLKQGSANVPIQPNELDFDVLRPDGKSARTGWAKEVDTGALKISVAEPGDYVLKSPRIAGFAPIADRPVHLEEGGTTDVVIELVRE